MQRKELRELNANISVIAELGHGCQGSVYLVEDNDTH